MRCVMHHNGAEDAGTGHAQPAAALRHVELCLSTEELKTPPK